MLHPFQEQDVVKWFHLSDSCGQWEWYSWTLGLIRECVRPGDRWWLYCPLLCVKGCGCQQRKSTRCVCAEGSAAVINDSLLNGVTWCSMLMRRDQCGSRCENLHCRHKAREGEPFRYEKDLLLFHKNTIWPKCPSAIRIQKQWGWGLSFGSWLYAFYWGCRFCSYRFKMGHSCV